MLSVSLVRAEESIDKVPVAGTAPAAPPPSGAPPPASSISIDQVAPSPPSRIGPRADVAFRYMPASSTPALGASGEFDWGRFGLGLQFLGAWKSTDIGTATLVAIAALASFDALQATATTSFRVQSELGVAVAVGSPNAGAEGRTATTVHAAFSAGLQQIVPLPGGYDLLWLLGGGFASSLNADANRQRVVGLGGGFVMIDGGMRF